MAINFDNVSSAVAVATDNVSWTHTATGANTYMVVGIAMQSNIVSISSVVANSVSFNQKSREATILNSGYLLTVAGVSAGKLAMVVQLTGATTFAVGAVSYNGVSQATPEGGVSAISAGASTNVNLAVSAAAGETLFGIVGGGATDYVSPVTQTSRFVVSSGAICSIAGDEMASGGVSTTMSWSSSLSIRHWSMGIGFSLTAVASIFNSYKNMFGVGI